MGIAEQGGFGYAEWSPNRRTKPKLDAVQEILSEYEAQLPLTLRQIFYIMVARHIIEKTKNEYFSLGYLIRRARRGRHIPFESIHDNGSVMPPDLRGYGNETDLAWSIQWEVRNFQL